MRRRASPWWHPGSRWVCPSAALFWALQTGLGSWDFMPPSGGEGRAAWPLPLPGPSSGPISPTSMCHILVLVHGTWRCCKCKASKTLSCEGVANAFEPCCASALSLVLSGPRRRLVMVMQSTHHLFACTFIFRVNKSKSVINLNPRCTSTRNPAVSRHARYAASCPCPSFHRLLCPSHQSCDSGHCQSHHHR